MAYTKRDIENMSEMILSELNLSNTNTVDVIKVAKELGFTVYKSKFERDDIDGIVINSNEEKSIHVNEDQIYQRQRFTIAHEIGHIVLHHDMEANYEMVDYRTSGGEFSQKEFEANSFAAALLMPKEKVTQVWNDLRDVDDVADVFQVSKRAASIRLMNLELI